MARDIREYATNVDPAAAYEAISRYLQGEGYRYREYEGEWVFQKGHGLVCGPTFFKFTFLSGLVRMETWMKYAVVPGVYAGEIGVEDFVGWAVKGPWKDRIRAIEGMLQPYAPPAYYAPAPAPVTAYCTGCGTPLPPDARFCSRCGTPR